MFELDCIAYRWNKGASEVCWASNWAYTLRCLLVPSQSHRRLLLLHRSRRLANLGSFKWSGGRSVLLHMLACMLAGPVAMFIFSITFYALPCLFIAQRAQPTNHPTNHYHHHLAWFHRSYSIIHNRFWTKIWMVCLLHDRLLASLLACRLLVSQYHIISFIGSFFAWLDGWLIAINYSERKK